jgi:putative ABC transport system substrate-binding protein
VSLKRRDFITLLGGAAAAWPLAARAQQHALPVVAFVSGRLPDDDMRYGAAFRKGLGEASVVPGQSAAVEYHWLGGQYDVLPSLMAELVRRQVAVIATPGSAPAARAAKAATAAIPIVFGVPENPVALGLVASLARPGGNATGINFLSQEVLAKQLGLLHDLLPKAKQIAVIVNPANVTNTENTLRALPDATRAAGMVARVLKASTIGEIDAAFADLAREPVDALLIASDAFFGSRIVQFAIMAAHQGIPTASAGFGVEAGLLMSYGTDAADTYRQVGNYAGRILRGAKPADLPVIQSTKFEFLISMTAAKALGLEIPAGVLSFADEVIE